MTEPTTPLPESPHCRVRARVASIWADGPDAGTSPDWRPAVGEKVTLVPSISSQLLVYDAAGASPIIVTVERVQCEVDADGWLVKADGRPVYIAPTDDPLLSATGWTWTATIKGKAIAFSAPAGGVVDLALYVATPAVDATEYVSVVQIVADYLDANPPDVEQAVADWLTANPPAAAPDATTAAKGLIRLAGDLGGTADAPTVPSLADKADADHDHTAADIDSGAATDGHVLTADGAGGAVWEAPPAGTGGSAPSLPLAGRRAVAYGDSNTYLNGFQPVVKAALGLTEYVNRGRNGGMMAGTILTGIESYTDHDTFDIVTIWASGNDFSGNKAIGALGDWTPESYDTTGTFLGAYRRALDHILADNPSARIILVTITNRLGKDHPFTNTIGNTLDDYNDAIKAVGELYALPVCDMNSLAGINEKTLDVFTYDGLHLSPAGFERAGLVLANFIAQHAGLGPGSIPPPEPDTTAPIAGTLAIDPSSTSALGTVTGASDAVALDAAPYSFRLDAGAWSAWQAADTYTWTGLTAETAYTFQHRVIDAAGNIAEGAAVTDTTDAPVVDSIPPTVGTMAVSGISDTGFTVTVTGAADETALDPAPYSFTTDGGATWTAYQASATYTATGLTAETAYSVNWRVKDEAGNVSTGTAQTVTTDAAPGGGGSGSFDFLQSATFPENAGGSHTFAAQNLGAEAADRVIVAVVSTYTSGPVSVTSVTIGGVEATLDVANSFGSGSNVSCVAVARASVPNGTTGDVVISYSSPPSVARPSIGLYRVTGASLSVVDTDAPPPGGGVQGGTLAVQAGGVAVVASASAHGSSGATATWEGITNTWVHAEFAAQGGGYAAIESDNPAWTYSVTWSSGNNRVAAAVSYALT